MDAFTKGVVFGFLYFAGISALWLGSMWAVAQPTGTNTAPNKVPVVLVASLPTCNTGNEGLTYGVSDQATAVAYNGAVTGSGATHQGVYCNGTAWVQQ